MTKPVAAVPVDVTKISNLEQQAVRRAMQYWVEHWDWECPTLFGIELNELKRVLQRWPLMPGADDPEPEAAAIGSLRELIHGASSLPKPGVHGTIGFSYDRTEALIETPGSD